MHIYIYIHGNTTIFQRKHTGIDDSLQSEAVDVGKNIDNGFLDLVLLLLRKPKRA